MNQQRADLMLVLVTAFWGSSYLFMKTGLDALNIFNLIALRFLVAFVITAVIFFKWFRTVDRRTLIYSLVQSIMLLCVFVCIMFGMFSTSASKAGFLVSLTVIFVPLFHALIMRKMPEHRVTVGALVSLVGIFLLTGTASIKLGVGDLLCILGAMFNAGYIVLAGRMIKHVHTIAFSIWQMGFTGILALIISFLLEKPQLPGTAAAWISVMGLGILCSAAGYMMQTIAQRFTTSNHAGLIFTLEPVFAVLFAYLFTGETLSARGYVGAGMVLLSVAIMEMNVHVLNQSVQKLRLAHFFRKKVKSIHKLPNKI
ncbi:DMT family transporter [Sporolactobacillus sp. STCC-11]|uniref:DMT family transporter n=1 Tax=Sporolactobacillus caesalpiniae TaxID=3230362 RepID=UPI003391A044